MTADLIIIWTEITRAVFQYEDFSFQIFSGSVLIISRTQRDSVSAFPLQNTM